MDSGGPTSAAATELISSNGNVSGLYWAGGPTSFEIRPGRSLSPLHGCMLFYSPAGKASI
jgi:hypothetical protein